MNGNKGHPAMMGISMTSNVRIATLPATAGTDDDVPGSRSWSPHSRDRPIV